MSKKLLTLSLLVIALASLLSCGGEGGATVAKIQKDRVAYVGTVPFEPPLLYQVSKDLVGPEANLAHQIVERIRENIGVSEVKLTWINRTYPTLMPALLNQEIDFVLGVFAITDERKQEIAFSQPYYTSELVLVVNPVFKDLTPASLEGARIGVREGSGIEGIVAPKYASSKIVPYKTLDDAVLSLRRSEIDCVIDDRLLAAYSLATTPGVGHMEIVPEVLGTLEVGVAFRESDKNLLAIANEVIAKAKQENLYSAWLSEHLGDEIASVAKRRTDRLDKAKKASQPRSLQIRVSRDADFDFDIYRMANLKFIIKDQETGNSYNSSAIDFQGSTGVASAMVPPGTYTLSLPKFNFSYPLQITANDPTQVPVTIRLTAGGVLVRKG